MEIKLKKKEKEELKELRTNKKAKHTKKSS